MSHIMENSLLFFLRLSRRNAYEKLSSVLFALCLNDLETCLCSKCCNGVNFEYNFSYHMELLDVVLLYTDDQFVLGHMETILKIRNLDIFFEYSELWHNELSSLI